MAALTVGTLAKRTGLTVRTLHHYDEIGLLSPSGRTDAGYRLYSDADVRRLERIVLLRGLGMPLDSIASALKSDGHELLELLERHSSAVDTEIEQMRKAQSRLTESIAQLRSHRDRSTDDALTLIDAVSTFQRYFTDEQRQEMRARAEEIGHERIRQAELRWARRIGTVR